MTVSCRHKSMSCTITCNGHRGSGRMRWDGLTIVRKLYSRGAGKRSSGLETWRIWCSRWRRNATRSRWEGWLRWRWVR